MVAFYGSITLSDNVIGVLNCSKCCPGRDFSADQDNLGARIGFGTTTIFTDIGEFSAYIEFQNGDNTYKVRRADGTDLISPATRQYAQR